MWTQLAILSPGTLIWEMDEAHQLSLMGLHWVQGSDLNRGPSGYEPDELPDCSTLQYLKMLFVPGKLRGGEKRESNSLVNAISCKFREIVTNYRLPTGGAHLALSLF